MRSGRRYSRYLALQTIRGAADSANKHDDVINGSVLHHNTTRYQRYFIRGSVLVALAFTDPRTTLA